MREAVAVLDPGMEIVVQRVRMGAGEVEEGRPALRVHDHLLHRPQRVEARGQFQLADDRARPAERRRSRLHGFGCARRGARPVGRAANRDAGAPRRHGPGRQVVMHVEHVAKQAQVIERAGVAAERVQRGRVKLQPFPAHRPPGRLEREHAAEGGRADRRAAGLGAERQRRLEVRHRRRRAAGGAARRARQVMRVARRGEAPGGGELGRVGLAEDQRARRPQGRDRRRVRAGPVALEDRRVVLRRHVGRVDHVLHAHRDAVQRAAPGLLVQLPCPADHGVRIDKGPGAHVGVALLDAAQAGAGQRLRRERPGADLRRRLARRQPVGGRLGHGASPQALRRGRRAIWARQASSVTTSA